MEVHVTVKYSYYRKYLKDRDYADVTLSEGATLNDLIKQLGIDQHYVRLITINGVTSEADTVLSHGDDVVVWPPLIGGG